MERTDTRAPGPPSGSREARNIDVARRFHEAVGRGASHEELMAFVAPDAVHRELPNLLFPQGAVRDVTAMREAAERGRTAMASQRYEVINAVATGDQVALEVVWTGTLAVPYGPLAPGDTIRAHIAAFMEFRDGKIVAQRNYDCYEPLEPTERR